MRASLDQTVIPLDLPFTKSNREPPAYVLVDVPAAIASDGRANGRRSIRVQAEDRALTFNAYVHGRIAEIIQCDLGVGAVDRRSDSAIRGHAVEAVVQNSLLGSQISGGRDERRFDV